MLDRASTYALVLIGSGICAVGFVGFAFVFQTQDWHNSTYGIWSVQAAVNVAAASLLIAAGFRDRRTLLFGTVILLNAASYCRTGVIYLQQRFELPAIDVLTALPVDAMIPYVLWKFARLFPQAFLGRMLNNVFNCGELIALAVGLFLIFSNLYLLLYPHAGVIQIFHIEGKPSAFGAIVYGMAIPVFPLMFLKMRIAREEERRRVGVFIIALLVTAVPLLLFIVATSLSETLSGFVLREDVYPYIIPLMQSFAVAAPIITTYAVLVERILPVHILLKQTMRYGLGHGFFLLVIALPVSLFLYYLYTLRSLSISTIAGDLNIIYLVLALAISALLFSQRSAALRYLDELFYRTRYDASHVISELNNSLKQCHSLAGISLAGRESIDQALHPESVYIMFLENESILVDPGKAQTALQLGSPLGDTLLTLDGPVRTAGLKTTLRLTERNWISRANVRVFVPIRARHSLCGLVLLGDKKSELPYTQKDFDFLEIAASTIATHYAGLDERSRQLDVNTEYGLLCSDCGNIFEHAQQCPSCEGSNFEQSVMPAVLHGRFALRRAIGYGGQGAVYLAEDLNLQREVVLKSLSLASSEESAYLRKEARLMAKLSHPNIATIYGYESFHGIPILVCEYLQIGTMNNLLRGVGFSLPEAATILRDICSALGYLHRRGVIHGDIKPSNIGIDEHESPKLLDFGLARLAVGHELSNAAAPTGGTYAYMSPEMIATGESDHRSDLWSLAVTMFEAIYGINPFLGEKVSETLNKIQNSGTTLHKAVNPLHPFFDVALDPDLGRRPQTAESLSQIGALLVE